MAKQYITNGINTSTTRVGVAAEDMENVAGKAVKLNSDGLLEICNTKGKCLSVLLLLTMRRTFQKAIMLHIKYLLSVLRL